MVLQMAEGGEATSTTRNVVAIGPLACVNAHVGLEIPLFREALLTPGIRTDERLLPRLERD